MNQDDTFTGLRWSIASYYGMLAQQHTSKMEEGLVREAKLTKGGNITEDELDNVEPELNDVCDSIKESAVSAIVFAGMAAEAYIYDYAARHLGKSYTDDHIDTLSAVNKWVVIPRLVTGNIFPKDRQAFQLLKGLVKSRNELVHYKAHDATESEITPEAVQTRDDELHENARNGIKALKALGKEIEIMHQDELAQIYLGVKQPPT